jgi:deazaflavin-dependent oxidoreductase (nitroreductase family)
LTYGVCSQQATAALTKRTLIHVLQKYLLNPPVKLLFGLGIGRPGYVLLETIGRKSGKRRRTPVGDGRVGNQFWIVAEHGMQAGYVRNIESNPRVRVRVRNGLRLTWLSGTAHILPGDDPRERQRWLARARPGSSSNSAVVRLMGTQLLTVRIDLDEP